MWSIQWPIYKRIYDQDQKLFLLITFHFTKKLVLSNLFKKNLLQDIFMLAYANRINLTKIYNDLKFLIWIVSSFLNRPLVIGNHPGSTGSKNLSLKIHQVNVKWVFHYNISKSMMWKNDLLACIIVAPFYQTEIHHAWDVEIDYILKCHVSTSS